VRAVERLEHRLRDRLASLGEVTARPLFGGHGLYRGETIFGILFVGKLYLKVDERSKGDYLARGMGPFRPNERQTIKSYYEVPPEVLDNSEVLRSCARETIRAGMDSQGRARTGKERRMRWP
jgi:DNA transformation protein and related proteins